MKRVCRREEGANEFTSVCVSSVNHHNEVNTFMLFSLVSPKTKEDAKKHKELELDNELDQFIEEPSSESILSLRGMEKFGKKIASAVSHTASSAFSHTASAVSSAVGRRGNSSKDMHALEKSVAVDIQETGIDEV